MSASKPGLIEILCDGGGAAGFGHLRRSAALGRELARRGHPVRVKALSEEGSRLLGDVPGDSGEAFLMILSLPGSHAEPMARARERGVPVLALDYAGPEEADLTLSVAELRRSAASRPRRAGLEYAMVREEIRALRGAAAGGGVVVMIGGGDQLGVGARAAEWAAGLGETVTLIEGPCRPRPYDARHPSISVLRDPSDLPRRMAACRWAIVSGGGSMLEMMCLGKPSFALPQTPGEALLAESAARAGGVLGIGETSLRRPDSDELARVSAAASKAVDGRGLDRIAAAAEELLSAGVFRRGQE